MHDFEGEAPLAQRRDDQPTGRQRRISLVMAGAAEGDQAIEVEVGATARALDHMVDVEAATASARLAAPGRAASYLALNRFPFEAGGRWAAARASRFRRMSSEFGTAQGTTAVHRRAPFDFCPRGQISRLVHYQL
jgi:hypothetical protein